MAPKDHLVTITTCARAIPTPHLCCRRRAVGRYVRRINRRGRGRRGARRAVGPWHRRRGPALRFPAGTLDRCFWWHDDLSCCRYDSADRGEARRRLGRASVTLLSQTEAGSPPARSPEQLRVRGRPGCGKHATPPRGGGFVMPAAHHVHPTIRHCPQERRVRSEGVVASPMTGDHHRLTPRQPCSGVRVTPKGYTGRPAR